MRAQNTLIHGICRVSPNKTEQKSMNFGVLGKSVRKIKNLVRGGQTAQKGPEKGLWRQPGPSLAAAFKNPVLPVRRAVRGSVARRTKLFTNRRKCPLQEAIVTVRRPFWDPKVAVLTPAPAVEHVRFCSGGPPLNTQVFLSPPLRYLRFLGTFSCPRCCWTDWAGRPFACLRVFVSCFACFVIENAFVQGEILFRGKFCSGGNFCSGGFPRVSARHTKLFTKRRKCPLQEAIVIVGRPFWGPKVADLTPPHPPPPCSGAFPACGRATLNFLQNVENVPSKKQSLPSDDHFGAQKWPICPAPPP